MKRKETSSNIQENEQNKENSHFHCHPARQDISVYHLTTFSGKLQACADLFGVYHTGFKNTRIVLWRLACPEKNPAVSSLGNKWLRSCTPKEGKNQDKR